MSAVSATATRPAWVSDELFPFTSRFVDVDGHTVHYVDEGTGPTLLMLHGNPTWSFAYRDVITALRSDFRCVAVDHPGFGLSHAAAGYSYLPEDHARVLAAVVEHLDLTDITLVLQDWGGPIGIAAAATAPDRYAGLVIANTWAWPVNGDLHFELFSRMMGGMVGRELIRRFNLFVKVMIPAGHRRRWLSDAEMAHYRLALDSRERRHATAVLPHAITHSRAFLAEVEAALGRVAHLPALIAWADGDIAFRAKERARWESLLPDHTTVTLRGAGHYVQSDAGDELATRIATWWRATASRP